MDLRQLEIIRAIAETGSFTGAGAKLQVSQSAISRQILLLEEELNEAVFLRVGRRVRITPAGEALLQLSHRVFQDIRDTLSLITDSQKPLLGSLRLVGGMIVALYVFPSLVRELRKQHPQADVKISAVSGEKCVAMLRNGSADLGLLALPVAEPELVTVPAFEEELVLIASESHPLAKKRRIVPHDLRRELFVVFEAGSNSRRVLDEFFAREHIEPRIVMDTENVEIMKAHVRAGNGIAIVPFQSIAGELSGGQYFCARVHGADLVRRTGWVYARASRVPRAVQAALEAFDRIKPRLRLTQAPAGRSAARTPEPEEALV
jgi:DNA-binding transcriptional LysR family regulator